MQLKGKQGPESDLKSEAYVDDIGLAEAQVSDCCINGAVLALGLAFPAVTTVKSEGPGENVVDRAIGIAIGPLVLHEQPQGLAVGRWDDCLLMLSICRGRCMILARQLPVGLSRQCLTQDIIASIVQVNVIKFAVNQKKQGSVNVPQS